VSEQQMVCLLLAKVVQMFSWRDMAKVYHYISTCYRI
jgi:hypothetical protein